MGLRFKDRDIGERDQPGLVGRVRHLKGEETLRHATLREIRQKSSKQGFERFPDRRGSAFPAQR